MNKLCRGPQVDDAYQISKLYAFQFQRRIFGLLCSYLPTCDPRGRASFDPWGIKLTNLVDWLVVLGFNATLTAKVISWQSVTHMCFLAFSHQYLHNFSFQSHRLLFSHASAEVRGENTAERKVASTGDQTHNHQFLSPTCSPLSHPGGATNLVEVH